MGRNKIFKEGKERIGVDLSSEELKAFDEIRWRERKGIGELARIAIIDYIKNHSDGNSTFKLDKWNQNPNFQAIPQLFAEDDKIIEDYKTSNQDERIRRRVAVTKRLKLYDEIDGRSQRKSSPIDMYLAQKKLRL